MKKTFLILIAFCTIFEANAQYQSIFGQGSTFWNYQYYNIGGRHYPHTDFTNGNDTLLNGKFYKVISSSKNGNLSTIYLREDITTGSVYSLDSSLNEIEIMNMTLAVGDSFCLDPKNVYGNNCLIKNVVDSVYYDSVGRKIIQFDTLLYYSSYQVTKWKFIEGIGPNAQCVISDYAYVSRLFCGYKDSVQVFINDFGFTCSGTNIGINEDATNTIKIYPNPARNFVNVDFDLIEETKYTIHASSGQLVLSGSISQDNKRINLSGLSNGLYLLKVENSFVKLVKTN